MNHIYILANIGTDLANSAKQTGETFGFTWPNFIAQCISFCIVAFLLHRFAYKPVLGILEERRKRISEGLANAEKIKAEVARTEQERQNILAQANTQANKMIEEARAAAARVQEQETQKAISQAEQIIAKAKEASVLERAKMLTDLKREVGSLVVRTTQSVTGKVLTADDQTRLAEETRKQLAA
ncbi:MAG: atpF [Verrucomicrobiales bacterium]|nr:atpF [Verrucomicrobiales bacterium]